MNKIEFGLLIRKLREAKNMSLRDLEKLGDVSFVNIAHIENGRSGASKKIILLLIAYCGSTARFFFSSIPVKYLMM